MEGAKSESNGLLISPIGNGRVCQFQTTDGSRKTESIAVITTYVLLSRWQHFYDIVFLHRFRDCT